MNVRILRYRDIIEIGLAVHDRLEACRQFGDASPLRDNVSVLEALERSIWQSSPRERDIEQTLAENSPDPGEIW